VGKIVKGFEEVHNS